VLFRRVPYPEILGVGLFETSVIRLKSQGKLTFVVTAVRVSNLTKVSRSRFGSLVHTAGCKVKVRTVVAQSTALQASSEEGKTNRASGAAK